MRPPHDICLACHGPISCNSGLHVRAIAHELEAQGFRVTICVPKRDRSDDNLVTNVSLRTFEEFLADPTAAAPSLAHLWTTREGMQAFYRDICRRWQTTVPYIVHLEDNETLLLRQQMRLTADEVHDVREGLRPLQVPPHLTHPMRGRRFLLHAAGVSALIDSLVDDVPAELPKAVFWPGYDPAFVERITHAGKVVRSRFSIPSDTFLTTYTGNVHPSNVDEVRSLYLAVALVNRMGMPIQLIRTGIDYTPLTEMGEDLLHQNSIELGMVPREDLPLLIQSADILVQPGLVDEWNSYRVPSKLPDFLVSGRPVLLPRVNLGTALEHGRNALVTEQANAETIAKTLLEWLPHSGRLTAIGREGSRFAKNTLSWTKAAATIASLYRNVLEALADKRTISTNPMTATR